MNLSSISPHNTFRKKFERFLEFVVLALMAALAIVVVVGVVFRKAGASLVWYDEVASILLSWLTYYGASLAALKRAHIAFPTLVNKMRPRFQAYLLVFREVVVLGFLVLLVWAGWRVMGILEGTTLVSLPWVPARVSQSVIPIGAVLFIVAELMSWSEERRRIRALHAGGVDR